MLAIILILDKTSPASSWIYTTTTTLLIIPHTLRCSLLWKYMKKVVVILLFT